MNTASSSTLASVREQLREATLASKCHGCGCFQKAIEELEGTESGKTELQDSLVGARARLVSRKYDCLGCEVCFPAIAVNAFASAFPDAANVLNSCPTEMPESRLGWPPLAGDYRALRFAARVAVCTLNDESLAARLAARAPSGLALVGTLRTENLGIERIITNVLADPHIRFLVLCGEDTQRAVGHLPGQSLESLFAHGLDERGRIRGAMGKRPLLKNVTREQVTAFLQQVTLKALIGERGEETVLRQIEECARKPTEAFVGAPSSNAVTTVVALEPERLVSDPAGFLVVYPDRPRERLVVEHYANDGTLNCVVLAATATAMYSEIIARKLISRLDHAAYLGRELARAERSLKSNEPYEQDKAPGRQEPEQRELPSQSCGCRSSCATDTQQTENSR